MKASPMLLLAFVVCFRVDGAESLTNLLSIYLVADGSRPHDVEAHGLKLVAEPILADRDFVAYNTNGHSFAITSEAAKRLAKRLRRGNDPQVLPTGKYELIPSVTPCVVTADGEVIYAGWFYASFSAHWPFGPHIWPDSPWISTNLTTNVVFRIENWSYVPPQTD